MIETPTKKKEVAQKRASKDTPQKLAFDSDIYKKAGEKYGVPWQIISAIHCAETYSTKSKQCTRHTASPTSGAGARGCTQFMPATFRAYGVDGDGDGKKSTDSCTDMIFSTANYISANYYKHLKITQTKYVCMREAIWKYNHAKWYVDRVIGLAKEYGYRE